MINHRTKRIGWIDLITPEDTTPGGRGLAPIAKRCPTRMEWLKSVLWFGVSLLMGLAIGHL